MNDQTDVHPRGSTQVDDLVIALSRFLDSWTVSQDSCESVYSGKILLEGNEKRFLSVIQDDKNLV